MIRRVVPALGLILLCGALAWAIVLYIIHSQPPDDLLLSMEPRPMVSTTPLPPEEKARRLELNSATYEELIALPGIGDKIARLILEQREKLGRFHYAEDLLRVKGIGKVKLKAIYDLIYVETEEETEDE